MKTGSGLHLFLVLIMMFGVIPTAGAEEQQPQVNWIEGGRSVEIGDGLATLDLAEDHVYLNKEDTAKLKEQAGAAPSPSEIGSIFPTNENEDWMVIVEYEEVGYIKDEEKNDIDADEILNSYKEGTEEANKDRKPEEQIHVVGWDVKPFYDEKTHKLEWSMLGEDAQKHPLINYNVQLLTRKGYVSFVLITDQANLPQDKNILHEKILANFKIKEGNRYEDFNEATDNVAEYGLTGLVLGGLGLAVAKKTGFLLLLAGLLKKGWVLILVLFGAIAAFFKKRFGRKTAAPESGPVDQPSAEQPDAEEAPKEQTPPGQAPPAL
jgi:uncharacterized membrane-anchored protein